MRIKCRGIEFRLRWNFCNFFACSSVRVDKVSLAFAIFNILLDIGILIYGLVNVGTIATGDIRTVFWVSIGNAIVNAIASAFVIYGHFKRNPGFYLPYMMNSVSYRLNSLVFSHGKMVFGFEIAEKDLGRTLLPITIYILTELFVKSEKEGFGFFLIILLVPLFVFLSLPIYYSTYKSLTTPESTRQQEQLMQPTTTLDIGTVELAPTAELPCPLPIVHHFCGTNTAAERASLHDSMADYKVI